MSLTIKAIAHLTCKAAHLRSRGGGMPPDPRRGNHQRSASSVRLWVSLSRASAPPSSGARKRGVRLLRFYFLAPVGRISAPLAGCPGVPNNKRKALDVCLAFGFSDAVCSI